MRRTAIVMTILGALLLIATPVWGAVAVPQLVKFPLSTNLRLSYNGSLVSYLNPSSGLPLAHPSSVPLRVDRHIVTLPRKSSSSLAVVSEEITLHYSGRSLAEHNVYVIGRRSMRNVASSAAYTFAPGNKGATPGSYYVTLPMNIVPGTTRMRIYKPESHSTYPLLAWPVGSKKAATSRVDGLEVTWFSGVLPMTPVAPYERVSLARRGFPMSVAPSRVEAELTAAGVSIGGLTKALAPVLSASEARQVLLVMTSPVPLRYYAFGSGLVGAETRTGAIVELRHVVDGIAVAPGTAGIDRLVTILSRHSSVPGVPAALVALRHLATAPPTPVYELRYSETAAAAAAMVRTTNSQLGQISAVTDYVPLGAAILGALLLLGGLFVVLRRRRTPAATTPGARRAPPQEPGQEAA